MKIGVLALQGDVAEHERALRRLGADPVRVKRVAQLDGLDGLVLPGGESPAIRRLLELEGLDEAITRRAAEDLPLFGTCAGLILLAHSVDDGSVPALGVLDVDVRRNAYGRQLDSFETALDDHELGGGPLEAVFIRAPSIERVGTDVEVLARRGETAVAVRQGRILACAFHPELTDDLRLYQAFLDAVEARPPS